jgi:hypothetical protein
VSLPLFHFFFIALSTLLSLAYSFSTLRDFFIGDSGNVGDVLFGIVALAGGISLFIYAKRFFKKIKTLGSNIGSKEGASLKHGTRAKQLDLFFLGFLAGSGMETAKACSACMRGAVGSTASAVNGGIILLLVIVAILLVAFGTFFLFLRKLSRTANKSADCTTLPG